VAENLPEHSEGESGGETKKTTRRRAAGVKKTAKKKTKKKTAVKGKSATGPVPSTATKSEVSPPPDTDSTAGHKC
jgi:hypothetical protein